MSSPSPGLHRLTHTSDSGCHIFKGSLTHMLSFIHRNTGTGTQSMVQANTGARRHKDDTGAGWSSYMVANCQLLWGLTFPSCLEPTRDPWNLGPYIAPSQGVSQHVHGRVPAILRLTEHSMVDCSQPFHLEPVQPFSSKMCLVWIIFHYIST